jgi:hypothetical protein
MRSLLHHLFIRPGTRAFDAAGGGRRWKDARLLMLSFPGHFQRL